MLQTQLRRYSCLVSLIVPLSLGALGCADPEGQYNDFTDRYNQTHSGTVDGGADSSRPDYSGTCQVPTQEALQQPFLFSLSAKLSAKKPIVCLAQITRGGTEEAPTVSMTLQPLNAKDRKTPEGDLIQGGPFPIAADGSFVADFGEIKVAGPANPISGAEIVTTVKLSASAKQMCMPADFVCGDVTGVITKPLNNYDLAGSTFTFQRVTDASNYPAPLLNCDRAPANPL